MPVPDLPSPAPESHHAARRDLTLMVALLGGPILWLIQFQIGYALVPWVCIHGHVWLLHLNHALFFLLAVATTLLAFSRYRHAGHHWPDDTDPGITPRLEFMALLGIKTGALFALLILVQGIAAFVFDPCQK